MTYTKIDWNKNMWPPSKWKANPEWQMEFVRASALVSDRYKFIFIHIAKTAGQSMVRGVFMDKIEDAVNSPGLDAPINSEKWADYFKFTFVRNPWDRMVSAYNYHIPGVKKGESFADFVRNYAWDEEGDPYNKHWLDQYLHVEGVNDGKGWIDFVGRFENLEEDWNKACKVIGTEWKLPHRNVNHANPRNKHYTDYYDDDSKKIVEEAYQRDLELYGYVF